MAIAERLAALQEEIAEVCARAGRGPEEITLVAVSKTHPASAIREAYAAGIRHIGENRVQEITAKRPVLGDLPDLTWHMIGHLQTNKARAVRPHLGLLHSLDRLDLAVILDRLAGTEAPVEVLLQVNTSGEASKSGVHPEGLAVLVDQVRALPGLAPLGLMTLGPLEGSEAQIRDSFALLRRLRDEMRGRHPDLALPHLSMGMSGDFPQAIREGATILRIGTRIFGPRSGER